MTKNSKRDKNFFPLLDYSSEARTITVHKVSMAEHSLLRGGIVSILLQHAHPLVKRSFKGMWYLTNQVTVQPAQLS